jgi:hypothetical protein
MEWPVGVAGAGGWPAVGGVRGGETLVSASLDLPTFVARWQAATLTEKAGAQQHFTDPYNQRTTWLDLAHRALDRAVLAAYGWPPDLSDDDLLVRLLALNLARAAEAGEVGPPVMSSG